MIRKFISNNWPEIVVALAAAAKVIGFMPVLNPVYIAVMGILFVYGLMRGGRLNLWMATFYAACALSIIISNPPAVFRSWERLGLFVLVTGALFPLFSSRKADEVRFKILLLTLWICTLTGVASFFCYLAGINYATQITLEDMYEMVGLFGGLTRHSMMLGPMAAIGCIWLVYCTFGLKKRSRMIKIVTWSALVCCFLALLLSASRAAVLAAVAGIVVMLFLKTGRRYGYTVKILAGVVVLAAITFPLWSNYSGMLVEKQTRNEAEGSMMSSRTKKWDSRIAEFEEHPLFGYGFDAVDWSKEDEIYVNDQGIVEPGTTWLAVFSMTGLVGAIPFYILVLGIAWRLWKYEKKTTTPFAALLLGLLVMSVVHQYAEGYALSAGSYFAFYFWLLLGVCAVYPKFEFDPGILTAPRRKRVTRPQLSRI